MNSSNTLTQDKFWLQVQQLWNSTKGNSTVHIAIIDGTVDMKHPSLSGANLTQLSATGSTNNTPTQHGTLVTSIIFGQHNGLVNGLAPKCTGLIIPIFHNDINGQLQTSNQLDLARSIEAVLQHKEKTGGRYLINISAGEFSKEGESSKVLLNAIEKCHKEDILIISASGNNGCSCLHVPAAHTNVLAVGALSDTGDPMEFSNWGDAYKNNGIMAPGENIIGALAGTKNTISSNGTSFATPLVSGLIGLLMSKYPSCSPFLIKEALLLSATPCSPNDKSDSDSCKKLLRGIINIPKTLTSLEKIMLSIAENENSSSKTVNNNFQIVKSINKIKMSNSENESKHINSESKGSLVSAASHEKVVPSEKKSDGIIPQEEQHIASPTSPSITPSIVEPSQILASEAAAPCGCNGKSDKQLIYVLGSLGVDFETDAVVDSFKFYMTGIKDKEGNDIEYPNPSDPYQLLSYLNGQEEYDIPPSAFDSSRVIWTINHDNTPIYAIQPSTDFEVDTYKKLREFLDPSKYDDDGNEAVRIDMVSIPGHIVGQTRLLSGQVVPVIQPHLRAMYNWRTIDLVKEVSSLIRNDDDKSNDVLLEDLEELATNFVNRIYYELQNLGTTSGDRALNYAATNIYNVAKAINHELANGYVLQKISVQKSTVCRADSDCQDALITFFHPKHRLERAPKVFRFTIDVSKVIPVAIGEPRTWFIA